MKILGGPMQGRGDIRLNGQPVEIGSPARRAISAFGLSTRS